MSETDNQNERLYTIGEIHRLGLLKTHWGTPLKSKGKLSMIIRNLKYKEVPNKHGTSKCLPMSEIEAYNAKVIKQ